MRPVPVAPTCPRCNGSGWVPLAGDNLRVEPCGCQGDLRKRERISSASIPKRYAHCTLDTFRDDSTVLRNAKKRVQEFVYLWPNTNGLLLMGGCGAGKTHLMLVALLGGLLGILMMIPLRRALIVQQHGELKYPEGTACAEVMKAGANAESRALASEAAQAEAAA